MINCYTIIQAIQHIIPGAQLSVWSKDGEYLGAKDPIEFGDYLINWGINNISPCPSTEEIQQAIEELQE